MTTPTDIEQLGYGGPKGSLLRGNHRVVIQGQGATYTLLPKQSGALVLWDSAAGITYTLPTPVEGMWFEFVTSVTRTSNSNKIVTAAATQFIGGGLSIMSLTVAESGDFFAATAASTVGITIDGDTKGGLLGGSIILTAISSTVWQCSGDLVGAGTLATPFV